MTVIFLSYCKINYYVSFTDVLNTMVWYKCILSLRLFVSPLRQTCDKTNSQRINPYTAKVFPQTEYIHKLSSQILSKKNYIVHIQYNFSWLDKICEESLCLLLKWGTKLNSLDKGVKFPFIMFVMTRKFRFLLV